MTEFENNEPSHVGMAESFWPTSNEYGSFSRVPASESVRTFTDVGE